MESGFDLFTTRRTYFDRCEYWKRDAVSSDLSAYVAENKPYGFFYAKERSPKTRVKQQVGDYLVDETTVTIETQDKVDISSGDIVEFDGVVWQVLDVQVSEVHRQRQFMRNASNITYMRLKS